ncbi:Integrase core domain-containing protein [Cnuella takakiae]|uniref:Integrase core domain-containing protein n=1 Tax=Cnuella takakiae TaxID=1302690 RepID=A0A1M4SSJ0_9BACT|nr:hypothetical protein BUE76_00660 [Cnuella takakiae]SHE35112.1 Integrase core domain-containing protein [Cnuella takakiae]
MDYSRPGKPTDNPFIESFNSSFRDECLNMHWFLSKEDAYEKIKLWIDEYNNFRPHSSLNDQTPAKVVEQFQQSSKTEERKDGLLAASGDEDMYFAAANHDSAASENIRLHHQILIPHRSPNPPL